MYNNTIRLQQTIETQAHLISELTKILVRLNTEISELKIEIEVLHTLLFKEQ